MDHAGAREVGKGQLHGDRRQHEAEHFLGDQHPALVELAADPIRDPVDSDIEAWNERQQANDECENALFA